MPRFQLIKTIVLDFYSLVPGLLPPVVLNFATNRTSFVTVKVYWFDVLTVSPSIPQLTNLLPSTAVAVTVQLVPAL